MNLILSEFINILHQLHPISFFFRSRRSSLLTEDRYGYEISDAVSTGSMAVSSSGTPVSSQPAAPTNPEVETSPHSSGIEAVKKLRQNYNINKVM